MRHPVHRPHASPFVRMAALSPPTLRLLLAMYPHLKDLPAEGVGQHAHVTQYSARPTCTLLVRRFRMGRQGVPLVCECSRACATDSAGKQHVTRQDIKASRLARRSGGCFLLLPALLGMLWLHAPQPTGRPRPSLYYLKTTCFHARETLLSWGSNQTPAHHCSAR